MGKVKSPLRFSRSFGIDPVRLLELGVFDPVLEVDSPLFLDPILLSRSSIDGFSDSATSRIDEFFDNLYRLLRASRRENDVTWEAAKRMLSFHEVPGTCLGYGGGSIHGSGWGAQLTADLLRRAKEIIDAGVDDHRLFLLTGLFSPGIGSDRLSDMYTNIIVSDMAAYTETICDSLGVPLEEFRVNDVDVFLPSNRSQPRRTPIFLLPTEILRDLPIAESVEDIWRVATHNEDLRDGMNAYVGAMWERANKDQKEQALQAMLQDPKYARELIDKVLQAEASEYDQRHDPRGLLVWTDLAYSIANDFPKNIEAPHGTTLAELDRIVREIIEQFRFLMEVRDLWRVLHDSNSRKSEKTAQRLFFSVAYAYCTANRLDVTPEADTGNGPVDFKFSAGDHPKILVELKLSKNNVKRGYEVQLPVYVEAEKADLSHYVVIDVGGLGNKWVDLERERAAAKQTEPTTWLIDATPRPGASTR